MTAVCKIEYYATIKYNVEEYLTIFKSSEAIYCIN